MYLQADARGRVYEFEVRIILIQIFPLLALTGHSHVCSECEQISRDCTNFCVLKYASIDQLLTIIKVTQVCCIFLNMNLQTSIQEQLEQN